MGTEHLSVDMVVWISANKIVRTARFDTKLTLNSIKLRRKKNNSKKKKSLRRYSDFHFLQKKPTPVKNLVLILH
jgi:hypothetical protein